MKYIFKFIEYINETNILSLATLILIIGYLRYLYNKKESNSIWIYYTLLRGNKLNYIQQSRV